jgi:hypothetical protein
MIRYQDLVDAINACNGFRQAPVAGTLESQLVGSLRVYQRRGEFDGTVASAKECLELAGYEFEPVHGGIGGPALRAYWQSRR